MLDRIRKLLMEVINYRPKVSDKLTSEAEQIVKQIDERKGMEDD